MPYQGFVMEYHIVYTSENERTADYLRKVWRFRALAFTFARRDLQLKYAQTWLGWGWTILHPMTGLIIYVFFFGYILKWQAGETPYILYVLSGLICWNLFSYTVQNGVNSIRESSSVIKKIYFPKLILPISKALVAIVEMLISLFVLIAVMQFYRITPGWKIFLIPIVITANMLCAITLITWISSFATKYRDIIHITPYLLNFGIWLAPVFFTFDILPESIRFLWFINPVSGVVEGFRSCIFPDWTFKPEYLPSLVAMMALCIAGVIQYARKENSFSDYI
jgi:lipopolysaccharide transport system permease protein